MNIPEDKAQLQHLVIRYLYGDFNAQEKSHFTEALKHNVVLQQLLKEEQYFESALPIGAQPGVDAERMQGNRWLLRQRLQQENRGRFSLQQWFQGLFEKPLTLAFQATGMAATFVLGLMLATPSLSPIDQQNISALATTGQPQEPSPLSLINDDDYEIFELQVSNYDAVTGDIDLSFSLASETQISGNIADEGIHGLMAVALTNDIDSASRLETIDVLQPVVSGDRVYEALIYVLTNDQNPGVRYQAVQSLVTLAHEDSVREALRYALSEDVNPGVRLEAFQALVNYPDEQTLEVFRQQMDTDSNEYIRAQARSIVEGTDNRTIEL
jgi:hypothetical protein